MVDPPWEPESVELDVAHEAEVASIAAEIAQIASGGRVLPGSILERRTRCGRANCACHADPPKLHGPYWQWTRKVANKTVGRWFSGDQYDEYVGWVDNDRRLRELLSRLEMLAVAVVESDRRTPRRR